MAVKKYKPVTPSLRGMTGYTFEEITKTKPERSLITDKHKNAGRGPARTKSRRFGDVRTFS
jgi:large subunit ribosomal protein L2